MKKKMTIITNREWCYIIVEKSDGITYNNARQRGGDELSNLMGEFLLKFWYLTWMEWLLSFVENWSWNQNYFGKYMHCYFPGHLKKIFRQIQPFRILSLVFFIGALASKLNKKSKLQLLQTLLACICLFLREISPIFYNEWCC